MTIQNIDPEVALANSPINQFSVNMGQINWEGQHRAKRNNLLKNTDWTQVADNALSAEKKAEWAEYRQQLRNITQQETWPNNPVWPEAPSA